MVPRKRSGATGEPFRQVLASLGLVGHLGFLVVGGALVGLGVGYGVDLLAGGRVGRAVGLVLGLASGIWAAGRQLMHIVKDRQGEEDS